MEQSCFGASAFLSPLVIIPNLTKTHTDPRPHHPHSPPPILRQHHLLRRRPHRVGCRRHHLVFLQHSSRRHLSAVREQGGVVDGDEGDGEGFVRGREWKI